MIYYFICDNCNSKKDFSRPIKEGPPKKVICSNCKKKMRHELGGKFILLGPGWPGKEIKLPTQTINTIEENDKKVDEHNISQKEADEVLKNRRKGKKHMKEFEKHNKQKVNRYRKNLGKGIRGK